MMLSEFLPVPLDKTHNIWDDKKSLKDCLVVGYTSKEPRDSRIVLVKMFGKFRLMHIFKSSGVEGNYVYAWRNLSLLPEDMIIVDKDEWLVLSI